MIFALSAWERSTHVQPLRWLDALKGVEVHSEKAPLSLGLCSRDEGQASAYCRSGPVASEVARRSSQKEIEKRSQRVFSDCPSPMNPLFLLDLHTEVERSLKKPYSAHIFPFPHSNNANVEGLWKQGYVKMPPVKETLASNFSHSEASSLKAPDLSSKPSQTT